MVTWRHRCKSEVVYGGVEVKNDDKGGPPMAKTVAASTWLRKWFAYWAIFFFLVWLWIGIVI